MKVSIVIPVFNVNEFIKRCVLSALNQTYKNIEIIIIDDCGTDDSITTALDTIQNHSRGRFSKIITHRRNRGLSAARNTGIDAAIGDYLYFLDGDDEISLDCIELLTNQIPSYNPDFVISDYRVVGTDRMYPPLKLSVGYIDSNDQILKTYFNREWYMMAVNKLVNRSFLLQHKLYFKEGIVHEDELWSFMLACKAKSLYVLRDKTYIYYVRPGSITQNPTTHNLLSLSEIIAGMEEFIKKNKELICSTAIYNFFEELKSIYFFDILSSSTNKEFKYSFYKKIRNSTYINKVFPFEEYDLNFARTIRNIHYILPSYFGFIYYKELLTLKRKLGV